jgi:hypothetical protein
MHSGPINLVQRALGADLYHCRYCRLQFYDLRGPVVPEVAQKDTVLEGSSITEPVKEA